MCHILLHFCFDLSCYSFRHDQYQGECYATHETDLLFSLLFNLFEQDSHKLKYNNIPSCVTLLYFLRIDLSTMICINVNDMQHVEQIWIETEIWLDYQNLALEFYKKNYKKEEMKPYEMMDKGFNTETNCLADWFRSTLNIESGSILCNSCDSFIPRLHTFNRRPKRKSPNSIQVYGEIRIVS